MKKIITYGTFDLFHEGHRRLLERAKALGDYLIVGVTTQHFDESRGKVNVVDSIMERIENVKNTGFVDEIIVEDHDGQKIEDIQKYGIDTFAIGSDWKGTFDYLEDFCNVVYLERTPYISSTIIRKKTFKIVRIGIIGTGRIAPRFLSESKFVSGASVEVAFNPNKESGNLFSKNHSIKVYDTDFNRFVDDVDAVYIASPNETHYEYAKKAISAGKHVLSEKPLTFTNKDTKELYEMADKKNVVLMEGIRAAYCPGFQQLINVAKSGRIGKICDVDANVTRLANPNSREMIDSKYGGAFLEYGSYALLPIIKLLGKKYDNLIIRTMRNENGTDIFTKVCMEYKNAFASLKVGIGVKTEGQLIISGTKGYIVVESPWWLTKKFNVRYENPDKIESYEPVFQGDGFRYEISDFVKKINGKFENGYKLTKDETIAISDIVEKYMNN